MYYPLSLILPYIVAPYTYITIITAVKFFSWVKKHVWNSAAEFRNSAFYQWPIFVEEKPLYSMVIILNLYSKRLSYHFQLCNDHLKLLILLSSDTLLHHDTFEMMHQCSWSLYRPTSSMYCTIRIVPVILGPAENPMPRVPIMLNYYYKAICWISWNFSTSYIVNGKYTDWLSSDQPLKK